MLKEIGLYGEIDKVERAMRVSVCMSRQRAIM